MAEPARAANRSDRYQGRWDRSFRKRNKIFSSGARPVITKWRKKNTARHYWRSGSGSVREHRGLGREMAARELVEKREEK